MLIINMEYAELIGERRACTTFMSYALFLMLLPAIARVEPLV